MTKRKKEENMKRILVTLILCLALLPNNAYAIAKDDGKGSIEPQDGEYTITVAPDAGNSGNSSSDIISPEEKQRLEDENNKAVSSDDLNIDLSNRDEIYTTTAQEDAELFANNEEKNDNNTLIMVISSIIGVSLGSVGTYLFMIKRR